jgi:hypothetical protein
MQAERIDALPRAWADYCDAERPLQQAIKLLGKARLAA